MNRWSVFFCCRMQTLGNMREIRLAFYLHPPNMVETEVSPLRPDSKITPGFISDKPNNRRVLLNIGRTSWKSCEGLGEIEAMQRYRRVAEAVCPDRTGEKPRAYAS